MDVGDSFTQVKLFKGGERGSQDKEGSIEAEEGMMRRK